MPGRPRTRYAKAIADWMLHELEHAGPGTMPELLPRIGYGNPAELTARQVAVVNMATRELLAGPVALCPWTGRLHYHQPGTPAPGRARVAP